VSPDIPTGDFTQCRECGESSRNAKTFICAACTRHGEYYATAMLGVVVLLFAVPYLVIVPSVSEPRGPGSGTNGKQVVTVYAVSSIDSVGIHERIRLGHALDW
jgi:hypothetical protein